MMSIQPVASSSRLPRAQPPPPRLLSDSLPRAVRRRLRRQPVFYLLGFFLPIISASPLPSRSSLHLPELTVAPFEIGPGLRRLGQTAAHFIFLRRAADDHPAAGISFYDSFTGGYNLPTGYVACDQTFNGGYIVLSYCIAFVGSLCTLELLIRRTTNSGWRNKILLLAAGITFGSVSTFAMHFIFNNSLTLHHPQESELATPSLFLQYDAGYTVLSLVVSCIAMTIAFFIMGTTLRDWRVLFGKRPAKADEYARWKQKKAIRRGTEDAGTLLARAKQTAPWSLLPDDTGGWREVLRRKSSKMAELRDDPFADTESAIIRQDKQLQELDFRLGRTAVKLELERRVGSEDSSKGDLHAQESQNSLDAEITPTATTRPSFDASIRHMASDASLLPNLTKNDIGMTELKRDVQPDPTFGGYDFPPHAAPSRVTDFAVERLVVNDAPPSFIDSLNHRRGSLPAAQLAISTPPRAVTLSRIQSLPEADLEASDLDVANGFPQASPIEKDPEELARIASDESARAKRVTIQDRRSGGLNRLEEFLGFDVVTRGEILKIFFTGSIAGMGVAGMREFTLYALTIEPRSLTDQITLVSFRLSGSPSSPTKPNSWSAPSSLPLAPSASRCTSCSLCSDLN